jgi:selenide,water dikinase
MQLNKLGERAAHLNGVTAMTDVTGFALLGHLIEMAEGSGLTAEITYSNIPLFDGLEFYTSQKCMPGNTQKNWKSFETKVEGITEKLIFTLCDPQTNGGLLIAVEPNSKKEFEELMIQEGYGNFIEPIGVMRSKGEKVVAIV